MFDLSCTSEQMLENINASKKVFSTCCPTPLDPEFLSRDEAYMRIKGKTPAELLPPINESLFKRFSVIPMEDLIRDVIAPVKKGVGNAYKRGNKKDPAKWITVEAVVTQKGAYISISDEGEGFDVEALLEKFYRKETYFVHSGSGFRKFKKSNSLISYANNGSTLLICFTCLK